MTTTTIRHALVILADLPVRLWTPGQVTAFYARLVQAKSEGHYLGHAYWPALALCQTFEAQRRRIERMGEQIATSDDTRLQAFWRELVTGEIPQIHTTPETDATREGDGN